MYPKTEILSILLIIFDLKWCIHLSRPLFIFQLLGECRCWWTSESPRAHATKFYDRLLLIGSVWEHHNFPYKIDWNCNIVGLLHHPFWLQLVLALSGQHFLLLKPLYLAKIRIWSILLIIFDLRWCIHLCRRLFTCICNITLENERIKLSM